MKAKTIAIKLPGKLDQFKGASGPGPARYSPDQFISSGLVFSPRPTIGNATRLPIFSVLSMRTPGIGDYNLVALDGIKHSPVRMPIGKAGIGELLDNKIPSTFPSPATYAPTMPAIK